MTIPTDSGPRPAAPQRDAPGWRKAALDLLFTLLIPLLLLSPNLLKTGLSASEDVFGGGATGNLRAYVAASLIPVVYVLWDLLRSRRLSPVAVIGGAGAALSGGLTFWYVDGFWYAVKDSARAYLTGLLFLGSVFTAFPLFRVFVELTRLGEGSEQRAAYGQMIRDPLVCGSLARATAACAATELLGGAINTAVNYSKVTAPFGTALFNAQIAEVNAIMRLPEMMISLLGVGLGVWLVEAAVRRRFGPDARLFSGAGRLWWPGKTGVGRSG